MPRRQPFDDFLNGGPTPRGRGAGRGRGGGGRGGGFPGRGVPLGGGGNFRGSPRGGGRGGRGGNLASDYSNVGFDYANIQKQGYSKLEGYSVDSFGGAPSDSPRGRGRGAGFGGNGGRGSYIPRGAQGQRGGSSARGAFTPSGAATPVTGLGYHGKGKAPERGGRTLGKSTVGKGGVIWGGGMAPLFVKAGELFKDGEVDVITIDEGEHIHVEALSLSDPSAPQMTDLQDDTEIEIQWPQAAAFPSASDTGLDEDSAESEDPIHVTGHRVADFLALGTTPPQNVENASNSSLSEVEASNEPSEDEVELDEVEEGEAKLDQDQSTVDVSMVEVEEETSLFFVDTEPAASHSAVPSYERVDGTTLGQQTLVDPTTNSDEEKIVFIPKTYREPEPITIPVPLPPLENTFRDPRTIIQPDEEMSIRARSRRDKKAAKREKRHNRGKKAQKARRLPEPIEGSDMEWGSDGPPPVILDVEGLEEMGEDDAEDDMAVLRDYLAGTLLNAEDEDEDGDEGDEDKDEDEGIEDKDDEEGIEDTDGEEASSSEPSNVGDGAGETGEISQLSEGEEENQWESETGSSGSSDLGDLEAALDLDSDVDDDIEALFNGKSKSKAKGKAKGKGVVKGKGKAKWSEEDEDEDDGDWFVRHMEAALNGAELPPPERKVREKIFNSIQNGTFEDDWDLPTQPAKKGKKKDQLKGIPAELQAQWEADRQKKAAKRQQRDIELGRLVADIERQMTVHRPAKGKGQGKARAASYAHLIPASASEVADMFDIDSDSDDHLPISSLPYHLQKGMGDKRNKKAKGLLPRTVLELDFEIREFLQDPGKTTYSCPPMAKAERAKIHILADCYGLGSKSRGAGRDRFT
ncbi:hypothetical protein BCR39DRAFT_47178 [Naematelia encephala]|uniref:R3H domain-containing protein n=1 Tax=Naematelia encephala TaxID=71784 RepID=A0A1Y2BBW3_9TREE|nr:hypothetical protein BCR39DRAFT_47178 [Naematelia encephala]